MASDVSRKQQKWGISGAVWNKKGIPSRRTGSAAFRIGNKNILEWTLVIVNREGHCIGVLLIQVMTEKVFHKYPGILFTSIQQNARADDLKRALLFECLQQLKLVTNRTPCGRMKQAQWMSLEFTGRPIWKCIAEDTHQIIHQAVGEPFACWLIPFNLENEYFNSLSGSWTGSMSRNRRKW